MLKLQKNMGVRVIRFEEEGVVMYSYPIGAGDRRKVIDELTAQSVRKKKRPLDYEPIERSRPGADAYMVSGTVFDPGRPERL